jgi:hypothetical protein
MNRIHYFHFGMERTGTTWIHENLIKHPEVNYTLGKENNFLKFEKDVPNKEDFSPHKDIENHIEHYKPFNVSFSNNPEDWKLCEETISLLDNVATHYGISFRNPFEMVQSLYNFYTIHMLQDYYEEWFKHNLDWLDKKIEEGYIDYTSILRKIKPLINKPFKVMFIDDLNVNSEKYWSDLQNFIGLTKHGIFLPRKVNSRIYIKKIEFNGEQTRFINSKIDNFSEYIGRDFSYWKRPI